MLHILIKSESRPNNGDRNNVLNHRQRATGTEPTLILLIHSVLYIETPPTPFPRGMMRAFLLLLLFGTALPAGNALPASESDGIDPDNPYTVAGMEKAGVCLSYRDGTENDLTMKVCKTWCQDK